MWLALAASIIPLVEWVVRAVAGPDQGGIPIRFSEVQEFFFAWFFLLYAIDLSGRLLPAKREPATAVPTHAE